MESRATRGPYDLLSTALLLLQTRIWCHYITHINANRLTDKVKIEIPLTSCQDHCLSAYCPSMTTLPVIQNGGVPND